MSKTKHTTRCPLNPWNNELDAESTLWKEENPWKRELDIESKMWYEDNPYDKELKLELELKRHI